MQQTAQQNCGQLQTGLSGKFFISAEINSANQWGIVGNSLSLWQISIKQGTHT